MTAPPTTPPGPQSWVRGPTAYGGTDAPTTSIQVPIPTPMPVPTPMPMPTPVPLSVLAPAPAPAAEAAPAPEPMAAYLSAPAPAHVPAPAPEASYEAAYEVTSEAASEPALLTGAPAQGRRHRRRNGPPPPAVPDPAASWNAPPEAEPPRSGRRAQRTVCWVKAHGGAGASTLAGLFGGMDAGSRWPDPAAGEPSRLMVVGRTNADGLQAVAQVLNSLREGRAPEGLNLLSLVLVADAPGRLPFSLARRLRIIASVAPVQWVPWVPAWRVGGRPKTLPREFSALADLIGVRLGDEEDGR
ncbi:DUF6668 family protein [Streptomyces sp. NPDC048278]|uniref:DUF6668 family protein n=1 Tax=Streptomyces sp. NPDC048278 TaxID=3155809 RepID=UPI00344588C7